jgi:hypothetical protein
MPLDFHTVEAPDGSTFTNTDKIIVGLQLGVVNASAGAGVAVTTAVSFPAGSLPAAYMVHVTPSQFCLPTVTAKTNSGFNVVLTPNIAANSIGAGTFDVMVVA